MHELAWPDLKAWSDLTGTPLTSWESQAMMSISKSYTSAIIEYGNTDLPAPYQPLDFDRVKVADKVRGALRKRR